MEAEIREIDSCCNLHQPDSLDSGGLRVAVEPLAIELVVVEVAEESVLGVGEGEVAFESAPFIVADGGLPEEHHEDLALDEEIGAVDSRLDELIAVVDGEGCVALCLETVAADSVLEEGLVVVNDEPVAIHIVERHAESREIVQEHPSPVVADAGLLGTACKRRQAQQPRDNLIFAGGHGHLWGLYG